MQLTKILCDRCGAYVGAQDGYVQIIPKFMNANMVSLPIDQLPVWLYGIINKDFCIDCAHEIIRYALGGIKEEKDLAKAVSEMIANPPSENEAECKEHDSEESDADTDKESKSTRTRIDAGKVMALRKVGWSVKQIAEEFSVSETAIYKVINKLKEEGRL